MASVYSPPNLPPTDCVVVVISCQWQEQAVSDLLALAGTGVGDLLALAVGAAL